MQHIFVAVWGHQIFSCNRLPVKTVQFSVLPRCISIHLFHQQVVDVSKILVEAEHKFTLREYDQSAAFVVEISYTDTQAQNIFARFKNIKT